MNKETDFEFLLYNSITYSLILWKDSALRAPSHYTICNRPSAAIAIIKHPRFDKDQLPQVKAFATLKKSSAVLRYLSEQRIR